MRTFWENPLTGKWTVTGSDKEYTKEEAEALQKLILKDEEIFIVTWEEIFKVPFGETTN